MNTILGCKDLLDIFILTCTTPKQQVFILVKET
jgi:hypothetical protein